MASSLWPRLRRGRKCAGVILPHNCIFPPFFEFLPGCDSVGDRLVSELWSGDVIDQDACDGIGIERGSGRVAHLVVGHG